MLLTTSSLTTSGCERARRQLEVNNPAVRNEGGDCTSLLIICWLNGARPNSGGLNLSRGHLGHSQRCTAGSRIIRTVE